MKHEMQHEENWVLLLSYPEYEFERDTKYMRRCSDEFFDLNRLDVLENTNAARMEAYSRIN